jgi:hypothetical protein
MKSSFITLLILGGFFLVYDAFLAPPHERIVFDKGPAPIAFHPTAASTPAVPAPVPAPSTTIKPKPKAPAPPSNTTNTGFVPPAIATLEEATQNWTAIPVHAFPRAVLLKEPVSIKMAGGTGQLAAGTRAHALAASQGVLTIAPSETSTARGQISVTSTDFPDQIRSAYEDWKKHRIQIAKDSWEAIQKVGPVTADMVDPSGKPIDNTSGKYELLMESQRVGEVIDVKFENISQGSTSYAQRVALRPRWDSPLPVKLIQGEEFEALLGPHAQATTDLTGTPKIEIYKNVYYLQKLGDAKRQLFAGKSAVNLAGRMQVGTSGFPAGSIYFHDFRCEVHPGFEHVVIITDSADQVIGIQFLENAPKSRFLEGHSTKWSTYNFVQNRRKAKPTYLIAHVIQNSNPDVLCWKSELLDNTGKSREWVEWYLPKKFAGLILHVLK